jgi:hypothetical protein
VIQRLAPAAQAYNCEVFKRLHAPTVEIDPMALVPSVWAPIPLWNFSAFRANLSIGVMD